MSKRRVVEFQVGTSYVDGIGAVPHIRVWTASTRPLSWDELQDVKREAGFAEETAVEIYPPDSEIVDEVPMRHLWVLPDGFPLPSLRRRR